MTLADGEALRWASLVIGAAIGLTWFFKYRVGAGLYDATMRGLPVIGRFRRCEASLR